MLCRVASKRPVIEVGERICQDRIGKGKFTETLQGDSGRVPKGLTPGKVMALPYETPASASHQMPSWTLVILLRAEFCSPRCFFLGLAVHVRHHVSLGVRL